MLMKSEMATTNLSRGVTQTTAFEELVCSPSFYSELQQLSIYLSAVNILLSFTAFFGNFLILIALHKESSLHPPSKLFYRCLATTDLFVGLLVHPFGAAHWMSSLHGSWSICRFTFSALYITAYTLCSVSLMTMTAVSVDRLLALLLGLRYKQVVTVRRVYIVTATFWIISGAATLSSLLDYDITFVFGCVNTANCLVISMVSYTKIFRTLRHRGARIQEHVQQKSSRPNTLNIARYRKAVYSALWVQSALVMSYLPYGLTVTVLSLTKTYTSAFIFTWGIAPILVTVNSTLNPFLYCWKISEVRQAVKLTIRQALSCPY